MYGWLPAVCDDASQVVTASHRLARTLTFEYNSRQLASGKRAWLTPVIVAWPDWLARLLATAGAGRQPLRINAHQSRVLWDKLLRELVDDQLVNISGLTRHARDAWKKVHEWQVPLDECLAAASSRDQRVFAVAVSRYRERLAAEGWIDDAMLGNAVITAVQAGHVSTPERVVIAGFDRLTPQVETLLAALREHGTHIEQAATKAATSQVRVVSYDDPGAELRAAGAWAHEQLREDAGRRVGIVVSGLEQDAGRAGRLVREGFVPGWQHAAGSRRAAVNVSLGRRLSEYPAIEIALLLLRWTHLPISGKDLSLLIRTPFLGAGQADGRARLELELRRLADRKWTPRLMLRAFGHRETRDDAADWMTRLGQFADTCRAQQREASPALWAEVLDTLLGNFGWPGEAALESVDFQLINRWRELLNDLARLEIVMPRISLGQAVGQLSAMASETVFQPEMAGAVIQVLGPLEAAGLEFDRLWIAGLTASQWPPPGRPTALISRRLQRHYGMPDADPDDSAAYAKRVIDRLLGSAAVCLCSYPARTGDSAETPTAFIAETPTGKATGDPGWHAAELCGLATSVELASDPVPPLTTDDTVFGGAATVQLQMAEPFSAFAQGRLGISTLRPIIAGLSPLLRGNLVHAAAFHLYEDCPTQSDIRGWNPDDLGRRIGGAVDRSFTRHERHADRVLRELLGLERARVARLLRELVAADLQRSDFAVHAVEEALEFELDAVRLRLRIDRIDRFDDGAVAILDYKTGAVRNFLDRDGEPTDAQLIVYASAVEAPVAELGFYTIDSRNIALVGSGRDQMDGGEWQASLQRWTRDVERAAREFAAGDVRLRYWQTLREARPMNILSRFGELRRDA